MPWSNGRKLQRVLLIGGGISGTAREILKYPAASVDYVELDPSVLEIGRRYNAQALDDPRIHIVEGDGRSYVRSSPRRYEVVIVDVPDPATSQANRYYTREFFAQAKRAMQPGGVLCISLAPYENYVSRELARMIATAHATLKEQFAMF